MRRLLLDAVALWVMVTILGNVLEATFGLVGARFLLYLALPPAVWVLRRRYRRRSLEAPGSSADDLEALPAALRGEWRRLDAARELVEGFATEGWIEADALREVDEHVRRLRTLLEADERTVRLGGSASSGLRRELGDLIALLVALADSAVEHQATLMSDAPVPVTLAEARDRLSIRAEAYRSLQQPGLEQSGLQQPG